MAAAAVAGGARAEAGTWTTRALKPREPAIGWGSAIHRPLSSSNRRKPFLSLFFVSV